MQNKISTSAYKDIPRADLMRRYYQMIGTVDVNAVTSCICPLPERPDSWSDNSWHKYKLIMARLPCKTCGWTGGSGFVMRPRGTFAPPKESVLVEVYNLKTPEGKTGQQQVATGTTSPKSPSTESDLSTATSISTTESLFCASGPAEKV
ncbi:unnamed protein product [Ascophyllum nodosum]